MENCNLSTKQEAALDLIMAGYSDSEAAKKLGVARQTISRWRRDNPEFIAAMQERRSILREHFMEAFTELVMEAITVVKKTLKSEDERVRLKTAMFVLKMSGLQGFAKPPQEKRSEERETFISALEQALMEAQEERNRKYVSGEV